MRGLLAGLAVLVLGVAALWAGTDGFRAFTSEAARRLVVAETPRPLPPAQLEDHAGASFQLTDFRGKLVLATFMYTRCPDICSTLGDSFERIHEALPEDVRGREVFLVSISFDPRDGPAELAAYAKRYAGTGRAWRFARASDPQELKSLLDAFGVVVIPDPYGGFQHNAAIHLVDRRGRLAKIFDYDTPDLALDELWRLL